jgi:hypothetical protein
MLNFVQICSEIAASLAITGRRGMGRKKISISRISDERNRNRGTRPLILPCNDNGSRLSPPPDDRHKGFYLRARIHEIRHFHHDFHPFLVRYSRRPNLFPHWSVFTSPANGLKGSVLNVHAADCSPDTENIAHESVDYLIATCRSGEILKKETALLFILYI